MLIDLFLLANLPFLWYFIYCNYRHTRSIASIIMRFLTEVGRGEYFVNTVISEGPIASLEVSEPTKTENN